MKPRLLLVLLAPLAACTLTREPLPLPADFFAAQALDEEGGPRVTAWIGLEVQLVEGDDLGALDLRPGVRVAAVDGDGPAARAGLRVGDLLLRYDGVAVNDPGRLDHLLAHQTTAQPVEVEVERGSRVFRTELAPELRAAEAGTTLAWVERVLLRVAVRDAPPLQGAPPRLGPEILGFGPDSPLQRAGLRVGERIVRFQGADAGSAASFVRRIGLALGPGDAALLRVADAAGAEREVEVRAWSPGTVLTRLGLWPLFCWEDDLDGDRGLFWLGDLLLVQLFRVDRLGAEKRWSVLGLFHWRTGLAMLEEEPVLAEPLGASAP